MKKQAALVSIVVVLFSAGAWAFLWTRAANRIIFGSRYQAVLLDNGQFFYGTIAGLESNYPVLTDVYYVSHQIDPQSKQEKNILVRRGNEWHAPQKTFLNRQHIVLIEPVAPNSQVSQLIAELKTKAR